MATILDSYSDSNYTGITGVSTWAVSPEGRSQSFTADYSYNVTKARFYLSRASGSTSQTVRAYLYEHSGTYGTSSVPGTLLATSDAVNLSDIGTSVGWIEFTFSTPYLVTQGSNYVISVMVTQGESIQMNIGYDNSPEHDGNYASNSSGSWSASSSRDLIFEVSGDPNNVTVTIPSAINTSCEAKTPTITYNRKINAPVINIACEAKIPNVSTNIAITINVPGINIVCESPTPSVRTSFIPVIVTIGGNYFTRNRYEKFEFELLSLNNEKYENAGWVTDYVIRDSSNITIDFSRDVIGSANLHIRNNTDINYLSDLIRPWYVLNDTYRFPLGTYMLSSPKKKSDSKIVSRQIQAYDLLLALEQDKMISSYSISAGTNVIEAIETLIYDYTTLWTQADIIPSDEVLATDVSYELGRSKLFIINSLLNMINYYPLWSDGNGVFRSIPWTNEANVCYEFIDDSLSIYTPNIELNLDYTNMYNRVVIINNQLTQNTAPLYKVWTFENENLGSHPFSYSSIGRYITKIFQSDAVSQDYVDLRARRELLKMLEIEEAVIYNHAFISARENDGLPWQGDSYRFKNSKLDVDSIYKLEAFTYNLKTGGLVNSKIKRIRSTY